TRRASTWRPASFTTVCARAATTSPRQPGSRKRGMWWWGSPRVLVRRTTRSPKRSREYSPRAAWIRRRSGSTRQDQVARRTGARSQPPHRPVTKLTTVGPRHVTKSYQQGHCSEVHLHKFDAGAKVPGQRRETCYYAPVYRRCARLCTPDSPRGEDGFRSVARVRRAQRTGPGSHAESGVVRTQQCRGSIGTGKGARRWNRRSTGPRSRSRGAGVQRRRRLRKLNRPSGDGVDAGPAGPRDERDPAFIGTGTAEPSTLASACPRG